MRALVLIGVVAIGCSADSGGGTFRGSGGTAASAVAGAASGMAGTVGGGADAGGSTTQSGGSSQPEAGSATAGASPVAGGASAAGGAGGSMNGCPTVQACASEKQCEWRPPGPIEPGAKCSLGSFSCGDRLGYIASDGAEFLFTSETAPSVTLEASMHCLGMAGAAGGGQGGTGGGTPGTGGSAGAASVPALCAASYECTTGHHGYCEISDALPNGACVDCPAHYLDCDGPAPEVWGSPGAGCETLDTDQGKCPSK